MRLRRAHDAHMKLMREVDVASIAPAAGDQRQIFDPRHRMPEHASLARERRDRVMAVVGTDVVHGKTAAACLTLAAASRSLPTNVGYTRRWSLRNAELGQARVRVRKIGRASCRERMA